MLPSQRFHTPEDFHQKSAQEPTGSSTHQKSIWEFYNEIAAREDTTRQHEWKELTDTILLLAALFSAVLAAFLVAIMDKLEPAKDEEVVKLLKNIYNRLSNQSTTMEVSPNFTPARHVVMANAFFYASLALLLMVSLMCMLVKGWNRDFNREFQHDTVQEERARKREYSIRGLIRYKLPMIVSALPILLQISLILFCIGLMFLLFNLDQRLTWGTLGIFIAGGFIYITTTLIAIFDSSAPFPSPVSHFFTHSRWWNIISSARVSTLKPSSLTRGISVYSLANWVISTAKNLKPLARSETSGLDYDVRIMNRIAQNTLVADENAMTFIALSERLLLCSRIQPCSEEQWRHIFSSLYRSMMDIRSNSAKRGILRVAAIVFDPNAPKCDAILEMTRKLLQRDQGAAYSLPSQIQIQPHAVHSSSHPQTRTNIPGGTLNPDASFDPLPTFESLSSLSSVLSRVHEFLDTQGYSQSSERIREQATPNELSAELLWLAKFVKSPLFASLKDPLRTNFLERSLCFLQEILVLVSMFLTGDATTLINDSMQLGLGLLQAHGISVTNTTARDDTTRQISNSGDLFILESDITADSAISFEKYAKILQLGTANESPISGMLVPLMLALLKADPVSSLYMNQDLVDLQPTFAKISLQPSGPLEHSQILYSVSGAIPSQRLADGFGVFLKYWNHQTQEPRVPLDCQYFDFFERGLDLLIRRDDRRHDRKAISSKLIHLSHPWLSLAVDAFLCSRRPNLNSNGFFRKLQCVDWSKNHICQRIVDMTTQMWIPFGGNLEPEVDLLRVFANSTTFRISVQCFSLLARLNNRYQREEFLSPRDITHLKKLFELVFSEVNPEKVFTDWLVLAEVVLPVWETLPERWKGGFIEAFRVQNRSFQWLDRVLKSLLAKASDASENRDPASQGDPDPGSQKERMDIIKNGISGFLPLLAHILESTSPALTQDEAKLLSSWNVAALPETFSEEAIRQRILATMVVGSSSHCGLPGGPMHENGAMEY